MNHELAKRHKEQSIVEVWPCFRVKSWGVLLIRQGISNTAEPLAKLFVIPECFYPRYRHSGTDMVFQAVRTRFPLRIVAGMTELGLLQEPRQEEICAVCKLNTKVAPWVKNDPGEPPELLKLELLA